jgi:heme ABC exporter ATP-binding subunit CcmA
VSLRVEPGTIVALLGPNGSGKTTLLRIAAGSLSPTIGRCAVYGADMSREPYAARARVGFLASETHLYDDLTAHENLRFTATMAGRRPAKGELHTALHGVALQAHGDERVRSFSSGMKRRLALARVELLHPTLLLLDEPYNSLDTEGSVLVDDAVQRTVGRGGAVILATHDAERALTLADEVVILERGAAVYTGSVTGYRVRDAKHVG